MEKLLELTNEMMKYEAGCPGRIQHFLKVHRFAQLIGIQERLDEATQFTLEAAALVHDIGIRPAEEKYGSHAGHLQEQEGPAPARRMLTALGFDEAVIDRVCYLVAHHHTCTNVDGLDYRILLEADFLVNLYEDGVSESAVRSALERVFRTETGAWICKNMFGIS